MTENAAAQVRVKVGMTRGGGSLVKEWGEYGLAKRELVGGLSGTVLELGAGRGANFGLLRDAVDWIGLEPHSPSRRVLTGAAATRGLGSWQVLAAPAERIPLPAASVDAVLSTVVLCPVDDLSAVLDEVLRAARPTPANRPPITPHHEPQCSIGRGQRRAAR